MRLTFANILMLLLAVVGCTSCIYEYGTEPVEEPTQDQPQLPGDVYLNLNVGVLTQTGDPTSRANEVDQNNYFESPNSKYERLNTLRIIIVRGERTAHIDYVSEDSVGFIEHNHLYYNFSESGMDFHDNMVFKVRGGEKKKIYLIANEKYLKDKGLIDFDILKVGTKYPQNRIEDIVLTADANNLLFNNTEESTATYIPMSESYEIDVPLPQSPKDYHMYENLFITRAAVKFSFIVNTVDSDDPNERYPDTGLKVKKIIVNGVSNKEYFLPRATYSDPITMSNGNAGRYITSYRIPYESSDMVVNQSMNPYRSYTFSPNIPLKHYDDEVELNGNKVKGYLYAPALYFPETKKNSDQKYAVTITIGDEDGNDYTFPEVTLDNLNNLPDDSPNLPGLVAGIPRNTHVVVCITILKHNIEATVKLVPYIGVTLEPEFGFDELIPWHNQDNPEE